jgi:hypothetical protein
VTLFVGLSDDRRLEIVFLIFVILVVIIIIGSRGGTGLPIKVMRLQSTHQPGMSSRICSVMSPPPRIAGPLIERRTRRRGRPLSFATIGACRWELPARQW